MGTIIDFQAGKEKILDLERESLIQNIQNLLSVIGLEANYPTGDFFVPQGIENPFPKSDFIRDFNKYYFPIDTTLIKEGWNVCGAIKMDENYFLNKEEFSKILKWKFIREKFGKYNHSLKPVAVFYGRNDSPERERKFIPKI